MKTGKVLLSLIAVIMILMGLSRLTSNSTAQNLSFDIFVANTEGGCSGKPQCFYNDDPDTPQAIGLNKALTFARNNNLGGARIHILSPYQIKSGQVTIDFPVKLIGENDGWLSTSSSDCSQPMLLIKSEVTLKNLHITDGSCTSPSRDLVIVQSPHPVLIENTTFEYGRNAIVHKNGLGNLIVRFREIKSNDGYALLSENNEVTSRLQLTANNIFDNRNQPQVICQNNNEVNHNFWGTGIMASESAQGCGADNLRMLGAPIVSAQTGVQAASFELTSSYPSYDFYGFSAKSSGAANIYAINHGNIRPFPSLALDDLTACSNYFDIFSAEGSQPQSMTLRFSYAGNSVCEQAIQSISLCGSGSMQAFPLMWLDPKTGVTAGWDNAGDSPQGETGGIFSGQEVRCNLQGRYIEVLLDNDGRPDLKNDLTFTPFVLGFEISAVSFLRALEKQNGTAKVNWGTIRETNTSGFRIFKATSQAGPWSQIGGKVPALGGPLAGHVYVVEDGAITPSATYYYKLEVIGDDESVQQTIGPMRLAKDPSAASPTPRPTSTSRPTSTRIPTSTPTVFATAPNTYRSPTPTYTTATPEPTEENLVTATPTLEPFQKPTNLQSTETKRPTQNPGTFLDKDGKQPSGEIYIYLILGAAIVGGIVVTYLYLTRKKG